MINLLEEIKTSLNNLNSSAKVVMLNDANNELEILNTDTTLIRIKTDFSGDAINVENNSILYNEKSNIEFLSLDDWDNADSSDIAENSSFQRVLDMKELANSVFSDMFYIRNIQYNLNKVTWTYKPIWRAYNGTMSGIMVSLKYSDIGQKKCSYV
jgi:hypothetical protein